MKLGLNIPETTWKGGPERLGATLAEIVQSAESAGFESIAVADHLWHHPIMGGPEVSQIEAYTTLGFIAPTRGEYGFSLTALPPDWPHPYDFNAGSEAVQKPRSMDSERRPSGRPCLTSPIRRSR